jgi:putative methionine-R-sulfoxide reductase with GAF domain
MEYSAARQCIQDIVTREKPSDVLPKVVDFLYTSFEAYSWVGVYLVHQKDLVLGPWQGKQATEHTRIPIGMGVCGAAAQTGNTEIVADVTQDTRYLACFLSTRSEIVVPIKKNGVVIGEIDIDSDVPDAFTDQDTVFLEFVAENLSSVLSLSV